MTINAPGPTTIFLARHGQSENNNQGLVTGQMDVGLSPKGELQALALAQCLKGESLAAIYTSTLRRTVQTAQPTADALGLPIVQLPGLAEIHMGSLEGRFRDERDPEAQALWAQCQADLWHFVVPGGEGFTPFAERVGATLQDLLARHAGQKLLIVGHRATNRVLLGLLLGWPRARWEELRLRNKFFYRVQPGDSPTIATYTLSGSKTGRCEEGFVM
ncbi:fructose-2,6-bisphosphatase [Burkholderiales bacterium JOSHI_001]|nr:fructose-2,6-bisphosphatase [Burkholderiales bacterium JOSHI_001]